MKEKIINETLNKISKSTFRTSFKLKENDINYIKKIGINNIKDHAYDFIEERLSNIDTSKDGKQTPTKGHPVFIAQHATATCCRSCLEKWHGIPKGRKLKNNEKNYIVAIIMTWIINKIKNS